MVPEKKKPLNGSWLLLAQLEPLFWPSAINGIWR
eukprot:CAMPEP_0197687934 /NCGR_PEP_ID=MMETSP1338-20131121/104682_1 /TAXON_ID=43686 ORGANISM="Pelagodinium beii, Strain RCC1491" /NCGR_SAMPLE_ID=MMETSP1338 /ASSEMBLY_ACC=CAM_ASM_000754 /LENGTH=33 /DNA_ID= /DNA_START= /DNA_END= /DNA_ORIENTATION=